MNNKIMILLLGMFFLSFASALEPATYKANTEINVTITCLNNGYCSSSSYCNINIEDPVGRLILTNTNMTYQVSSHIYTITPTEIGDYRVTGFCQDGSDNKEVDFIFTSTGSGFAGTLGFYFLILVLSLGIIILGFSLKDAPIVILGSFGLYFIGLYVLFNGIDGFKDPVYTWAIGIIILMTAAYISIRSAWELIVD